MGTDESHVTRRDGIQLGGIQKDLVANEGRYKLEGEQGNLFFILIIGDDGKRGFDNSEITWILIYHRTVLSRAREYDRRIKCKRAAKTFKNVLELSKQILD